MINKQKKVKAWAITDWDGNIKNPLENFEKVLYSDNVTYITTH